MIIIDDLDLGTNDSYSQIAMGNVWLQNMQQPIKDKEKVR